MVDEGIEDILARWIEKKRISKWWKDPDASPLGKKNW